MKHIIIGLDGTWRAAFKDNFQSNIYRLNLSLENKDNDDPPRPQIFIYSVGVGTAGRSSQLPGGVFGEGLDQIILQAYINLVSNYAPGDKLYIFGFSRGAVAARALCSMIYACGLLKANSSWLIEHAWHHFTKKPTMLNEGFEAKRAENTHRNVKIEFLGLWDTVSGPIGQIELFKRYRFQGQSLEPIVRHGVHIVAIDDVRRHFAPILWSHAQDESEYMEQIWMPGVHTDVGGEFEHSFLSTLSLLLMLDKLAEFCPTIGFDNGWIKKSYLDPLRSGEIVINDEWMTAYGFRNFLGKMLLSKTRQANDTHEPHKFTEHPITKFIVAKPLRIRGRHSKYVPTYKLVSGKSHLPETELKEGSWTLLAMAALRTLRKSA